MLPDMGVAMEVEVGLYEEVKAVVNVPVTVEGELCDARSRGGVKVAAAVDCRCLWRGRSSVSSSESTRGRTVPLCISQVCS